MSLIQHCQSLFTDEIKEQIYESFSIDPSTLKELEGFSSYVFRAHSEEHGDMVLKVSHSSRLSPAVIKSELDFVQFLAAQKCAVAKTLTRDKEPRFLALPDGAGHEFLAYGFEFIEGQCYEDIDKSEESLIELGRSLAHIHNASERFTQDHRVTRPSLTNNVDYQARTILPQSEEAVVNAYEALLSEIQKIPESPEFYGLIHSDAHDGNLIQHKDRGLVFIDFDDCEFHYFLNDLAIMLYTFFPPEDCDDKAYTEFVFLSLLKGYLPTRPIPSAHFQFLPLFLKFRAFMIHMLSAKVAQLTGVVKNPEAAERRRKRILSNFEGLGSLLDHDFEMLARGLSG